MVTTWAAMLGLAMALAGTGRLPSIELVALGAGVGGATSNLIDKLLHGAVIDFIVIFDRPAFNLADAIIVACVAVAAFSLV